MNWESVGNVLDELGEYATKVMVLGSLVYWLGYCIKVFILEDDI